MIYPIKILEVFSVIRSIYLKIWNLVKTRPWRLLGISLLSVLIVALATGLTAGVPLFGLVIGALIDTAMAVVYLKGIHGEDFVVEDIFAGFRDWDSAKRILGGVGWAWLWIFLWCLIPIVGPIFGIIRSYEYRLVPFILMKEPEVGIKDARLVSKERTAGYKGKMFAADVLWIIGGLVVMAILTGLSGLRFVGWIFLLVNVVFIVAFVLCSEFILGLVKAGFYDVIQAGPKEEKHCPTCGTVVNEGDAFCSACGTKIE